MRTYKVTRELKVYREKTVTVPDDMHEDDVVETAWCSDSKWVESGSRDMNIEVEEI